MSPACAPAYQHLRSGPTFVKLNRTAVYMDTTPNPDTMNESLHSGLNEVYGKIILADTFRLLNGVVNGATSQALLLEVRDEIAAAQRKLKAYQERLEESLIAQIDQFGDIELGNDNRLYVGNVKITKAKSDREVFDFVLASNAGDYEVFQSGEKGVLVAQPWKTGAVKEIIGAENFDNLFDTEYQKDIKTGVSKRKVKVYDPQYSKV